MTTINIKEEHCPKNHACPVVTACPVDAVTQKDHFSAPAIDEAKCKHCGLCCNFCQVFSCGNQ